MGVRLPTRLPGDDRSRAGTELAHVGRVHWRTVLLLLVTAVAVNLLLPRLDELHDSGQAVRRADVGWLGAALAVHALSYVFAAFAQMGVTPIPMPFRRLIAIQVGTSFTNRLLPGGVGGAVLNERAMERAGVERATATGLVVVKTAEGAASHLVLGGLAIAFAERGRFFATPLPHGWPLLVAALGALVVAGLVLWTPFGHVRLIVPARRTIHTVVDLVAEPARALQLIGGNLGVTLCLVSAMALTLRAFDAGLGLVSVAAVYLAATAVASAAPTPGNVGAVEAALVAGFTAAGVGADRAVAAVLTFRLVTFWLPILPGWIAFARLRRHGTV